MENGSVGDQKTVGREEQPGGHAYALRTGEVLGQYKIVKPLGAGGMGEVYLAENIQMHKRYALKVLPESLSRDPQFIGRFKVEARVMADLDHPHIVRVHHMGEERGLYYIAMDYVEGPEGEPQTLEDSLTTKHTNGTKQEDGKQSSAVRGQKQRMPEAEVQRVALEICSALEYAHGFRNGVIHRDLKPSNILLNEHGGVRISDFGLAKVIGESYLKSVIERSISLSIGGQVSIGDAQTQRPRYEKTSTRSILGTYDYMSPEQKTGAPVTARSDIYALGMILYRMLTGVKAEAAYKPPSRFGVAKAWDGIVHKCLEPDPDERYANAGELKKAIEATANGRKWTRMLAGGVVLLGLAAAGWGVWISSQESGVRSQNGAEQPTGGAGTTPSRPAEPSSDKGAAPPATAEVPIRFEVQPAGAKLTIFGDQGVVASGETGAAGVFEASLAPGKYELDVQKDGYLLLSQGLNVKEPGTLRLELTPLRGPLTIQTTPGAKVEARGASGSIALGVADEKGELRYDRLVEGFYTLAITHPDYLDAEAQVEIRKDRPAQTRQMLKGKPGALYISASPKAAVWVDGAQAGATGERIAGVEPGTRKVEVRLAGYQTERFDLEVPPNRDAPRKMLGDLVRESGGVKVIAVVSKGTESYFSGLEKTVRIGDVERKTKAAEWVEDGLPCEEVEVRMDAPGFESGPEKVTVADGQTQEVKIALTPKPATLELTCNVPEAMVRVNEQSAVPVGKIEVPALVPLKLEVAAAGYATTNLTLQAMEPAKRYSQSVNLARQPYPDLQSPFKNSLGMEFLPVAELDNVLFCKWETRVQDFKAFVEDRENNQAYNYRNGNQPSVRKSDGWKQRGWEYGWDNPGFRQEPDHPVTCVSYDDAVAFCVWLTKREIAEGKIAPDQKYRLPKDWEWSVAVGLQEARGGTPQSKDGKNDQTYPWGRGEKPPARFGNYAGEESRTADAPSGWGVISGYRDDHARTSPVGYYGAKHGALCDLGGNVWEWCDDFYDGRSGSRVLRGAAWGIYYPRGLLSSFRNDRDPVSRNDYYGCRVVLSR